MRYICPAHPHSRHVCNWQHVNNSIQRLIHVRDLTSYQIHMPVSVGSSVNAIKQKDKKIHKGNYDCKTITLTKVVHVFKDLLPLCIS